MARTTKTEIRRDAADGRMYLWAVTESDVPGEGGQERKGPVTLSTCYENLTRVQRQVEEAEGLVAARKEERALWQEAVRQMEAAEAEAEGGKASKTKAKE